MSTHRAIAIFLALGGVLWAAPCFVLICMSPLRGLLVLGPVYLASFGYLLRVGVELSGAARRSLWLFSATVNGAWLAYVFSDLVWQRPHDLGFMESLVLRWCAMAYALSIYCLITEPDLAKEPGLLIWRHTKGDLGSI